jgi:mRNA interferase MazF
MVVVIPSTKRHRPELDAWRVEVKPPDGGLSLISYLMPEQIRAVAADRLISRYGRVRLRTMAEIEDRLRILLNL